MPDRLRRVIERGRSMSRGRICRSTQPTESGDTDPVADGSLTAFEGGSTNHPSSDVEEGRGRSGIRGRSLKRSGSAYPTTLNTDDESDSGTIISLLPEEMVVYVEGEPQNDFDRGVRKIRLTRGPRTTMSR